MVKLLLLVSMVVTAFVSCHDPVNIEKEKLMITQRMHLKVKAIAKDLRDYCDTEMHRKARLIADSLLMKKRR